METNNMTNISKQEKIIAVLSPFLIALFLSSFISEILNFFVGGKVYLSVVLYNFRHLHYAIFMPLIMPFLMVINMDSTSNDFYITSTILVSIVIIIDLFVMFFIIKKIRKGEFKSNVTKYLYYFVLTLCFEIWFLIGLIPAGMERV